MKNRVGDGAYRRVGVGSSFERFAVPYWEGDICRADHVMIGNPRRGEFPAKLVNGRLTNSKDPP
jgi:hypothetical protein